MSIGCAGRGFCRRRFDRGLCRRTIHAILRNHAHWSRAQHNHHRCSYAVAAVAKKPKCDNSPTKVGASHETHGITSPTLTREGTIRALCKITRAEMWSRSVINPQAVQTCSRSDNRFGTAAPQIHVWLVPGAWTGINSRPAVSALYVARRKRGHRRGQAVLLLQKIHQHIAQQRADFQHQLSNWLVQNYGTIAVEDL